MGIPIGIPLVVAGQFFPDARSCARHCLIAFAVVAATALAVGGAALAIASIRISEANLPAFSFPPGVGNRVEFARVGVMHNFSYLGGFVGILTGLCYLALARWRMDVRPRGVSASRPPTPLAG